MAAGLDVSITLARRSNLDRAAGENTAQLQEWLAQVNATRVKPQLSNGALMSTGALLQYGDGLSNPTGKFEVPQQHDRISKIARIHRRGHVRAYDAALSHGKERGNALIVQVREQLMKLRSQVIVLRHRVQVTVKAINDHHPGTISLHAIAHEVGKLPWRDSYRIDLVDGHLACASAFVDAHSYASRARKQRRFRFIKHKRRGVITALGRCRGILKGESRFS